MYSQQRFCKPGHGGDVDGDAALADSDWFKRIDWFCHIPFDADSLVCLTRSVFGARVNECHS